MHRFFPYSKLRVRMTHLLYSNRRNALVPLRWRQAGFVGVRLFLPKVPPQSWEQWDDLMTHFARHLVDRYGFNEVAQCYFEVWNGPNIDFWGGVPRRARSGYARWRSCCCGVKILRGTR
ncbi:MAG: GH39 family glycosyl hydrolase [Acidobacteriaceae bacterium]